MPPSAPDRSDDTILANSARIRRGAAAAPRAPAANDNVPGDMMIAAGHLLRAANVMPLAHRRRPEPRSAYDDLLAIVSAEMDRPLP